MPNVRKSIEINAPVSEVFAYFSDPANLPEIWPSMVEVSHIEESPRGGRDFDWVYKLAGIRFRGHAEVVEFEPGRLLAMNNDKGIRSAFRWGFEGLDDTTRVTLDVVYEVPGAAFGKLTAPLIHRLNEREAEQVRENLKIRMEQGGRQAGVEGQPQA